MDVFASSNYMNVSKKGSEQRPIEKKRVSSQSSKPNKTSGTILQSFYVKCIKQSTGSRRQTLRPDS